MVLTFSCLVGIGLYVPPTCIEFPPSCLTIEATMVDGVCQWLGTWWNRTILKPDSLTLSNHHYAIITRTVSQIKVLIPIFGFCDFHVGEVSSYR